jgi:hypothetical protein
MRLGTGPFGLLKPQRGPLGFLTAATNENAHPAEYDSKAGVGRSWSGTEIPATGVVPDGCEGSIGEPRACGTVAPVASCHPRRPPTAQPQSGSGDAKRWGHFF